MILMMTGGWFFFHEADKIKIPVFMYHAVGEDPLDGDPALTVKPDELRKHLEFFQKSGIETIFASEYYTKADDKEKHVVLTFDDGYEDNYTVLFPILKEYRMKATIFVPSDLIGKEGYLTDQQMREMADSGFVEFGSHTKHHKKLTEVSREQMEREEFAESKERISQASGRPVTCISYPEGVYNQEISSLAGEYFENCFLAEPRSVKTDGAFTDRTKIPRYGVYRETNQAEIKIVCARVMHAPIERLKHKIKALIGRDQPSDTRQ